MLRKALTAAAILLLSLNANAQKAIHNIVSDFKSGIHSFTIIGSYGTGKSSFLLALESDLKQAKKQKYLLDAQNISSAKSFEILNIVGDYSEMSTLLSKALDVEGNAKKPADQSVSVPSDYVLNKPATMRGLQGHINPYITVAHSFNQLTLRGYHVAITLSN